LLHRKKTVVEDCLVLDINTFVKRVVPPSVFQNLQDWEGSLVWRSLQAREIHAEAHYTLSWSDETPDLDLDYDVTTLGGARQHLRYSVSLESIPCTYGGVRWWFTCPQCERRVGKLYKPPLKQRFACRHCHHLTYRSAQEAHRLDGLGAMIPLLHRYLRLEQKLRECQRWRKRAYKLREQMDALWLAGV
jgi:hypothetical protein